MTAAHRRYLRIEILVAAVINAVLSIAFVYLVFGGRDLVPVAGWGGIAMDAVPQSFMIALMSSLVPTYLARRRRASGEIAAIPGVTRLPRGIVPRVLLIAIAVAALAGLAHRAILPLTGGAWPFAGVLAYKAVYGGLLGAGIAAIAVRAALRDR